MQQLLRYGLHLGRAGTQMEGEQLANECKRLIEELKSVQEAASE